MDGEIGRLDRNAPTRPGHRNFAAVNIDETAKFLLRGFDLLWGAPWDVGPTAPF